MKRYLSVILLLGLVAGCPVTQRQDAPASALRIKTERGKAKYWLYVPADYSADRDWPLVITLHGTHGWDSSRAQIAEWKYLADQRGLIVAAPDLKSVQGILPVYPKLWFNDLAADEENILAVIDEICGKYRVDRSCILLTGFSAGGYPLYYVGLRNPQRFNMLVARNTNSSIRLFERIELTDEARNLPIVIFWGKDDLREINKQSWQAVRWLGEHGFKKLTRKKFRGGHLRRPETTYSFWKQTLPERHVR